MTHKTIKIDIINNVDDLNKCADCHRNMLAPRAHVKYNECDFSFLVISWNSRTGRTARRTGIPDGSNDGFDAVKCLDIFHLFATSLFRRCKRFSSC